MNIEHANWIWLDPALYPDCQTTKYNGFQHGTENYAVTELIRTYTFDQPVQKALLRFSGDTEFRLTLNSSLVATGPVTVAGDFLCYDQPQPDHYATLTELSPNCCTLSFQALVKLTPIGINEYSKGHGGFMLTGLLTLADGTQTLIQTDETWLSRRDPRYVAPGIFDGSQKRPDFTPSVITSDIWQATTAPIRIRTEEVVEKRTVHIPSGSVQSFDFDFPKIYAGFVTLSAQTTGPIHVKLKCLETDTVNSEECFTFIENTQYIGLQLRSIGRYQIDVRSDSPTYAVLDIAVTSTYYPVDHCAHTKTSDSKLNAVLSLCEQSLQYCRQMIHLDSPLHSEPLACTGDYYIETLMTAFSFGDLSLSRFDVLRTANMLCHQEGVMFHTTYSLIWVYMLHDLYRYTGDRSILAECEEALTALLARFQTYLDEKGLVDTPPTFMFIDWLYIDEISLHHPPKALGQTCLNMFYYKALTTAAKIYEVLDRPASVRSCLANAASLKAAINTWLYDPERDLYFEGLNTPTPEHLLARYMPQNVSKRYYRQHANILAVYCDLYEGDQAAFLRHVLADSSLGQVQPYFSHFVFEAVYSAGLSNEYALPLCENWKIAYDACSKGLQEGFIKPEPTYTFDHSHAWGGTPRYAIPLALSGLEILEPGFKRIRLRPQLLGLTSASVEIPTPYGFLRIEQQAGQQPVIQCPPEIRLEF